MALLSVIRRWHFRQQIPIREIERRTGLSRNTIRKYLRAEVVSPRVVYELWVSSPPKRSPRIWRRRATYPQLLHHAVGHDPNHSRGPKNDNFHAITMRCLPGSEK